MQVNLLPWRINKLRRYCQYTILSALTSLLLSVCLLFSIQHSVVIKIKEKNLYFVGLDNNYQKKILSIKNMEEENILLKQKQVIYQQIMKRKQENDELLLFFNRLEELLPDPLWLTEISYHENKLQIIGNSLHYQDVIKLSDLQEKLSFLKKGQFTSIGEKEMIPGMTSYYFIYLAQWGHNDAAL